MSCRFYYDAVRVDQGQGDGPDQRVVGADPVGEGIILLEKPEPCFPEFRDLFVIRISAQDGSERHEEDLPDGVFCPPTDPVILHFGKIGKKGIDLLYTFTRYRVLDAVRQLDRLPFFL